MKKLNIHYYENRKMYFSISLVLIVLGLIFNLIFGTQLDLQFTGGAVIKYSFEGEIPQNDIASVASAAAGNNNLSVVINDNIKSAEENAGVKQATISFGGTDSIELSQQQGILVALNEAYPEADFEIVSSSSVNPVMGRMFFLKCLAAVVIALVLLVIYIAIRFRKIGGSSAAITGIISLLHDVMFVYLTFVIFRMPLNDNFIAVVLTILGYSLNNTIVIFDRIRENKKNMGPKAELSIVLNASINQTFTRSLYTSLATFLSVATVFVVGLIYDLTSITSFALPMMIGIVVGLFSSLCIAGPLYAVWQYAKLRRARAKKAVKK